MLVISGSLRAYETDQYSSLFYDLEDSTEILDQVVNNVIKGAADAYEGARDEAKFYDLVKDALNARQLEKWVNDNPAIDSWNTPLESIYKTTAWFDSPIIRFKGLADSFTLNSVQIGSDKMSHFFGVGGIYYNQVHVKRTHTLAETIAYGDWTERAQWGELTTNVFSNADLVVNYEGYLFFRSLFEDGVVANKESIIKWEGDKPVINRDFTFRDHVNDFWSEALLPNWYQISIRNKVEGVLRRYCYDPRYLARPERFVSAKADDLFLQYEKLGLRMKALVFRMDRLCQKAYDAPIDEQVDFLVEQVARELRYSERDRPERTPIENSITDLNDLEEVLSVVSSPFPGCNGNIEKAWLEHSRMISWVTKNKEQLTCSWLEVPMEFERKLMQSILVRRCDGVLQYKVHSKFKTFWSDQGFYAFDDRLGYVYRNIPYLCKWY